VTWQFVVLNMIRQNAKITKEEIYPFSVHCSITMATMIMTYTTATVIIIIIIIIIVIIMINNNNINKVSCSEL